MELTRFFPHFKPRLCSFSLLEILLFSSSRRATFSSCAAVDSDGESSVYRQALAFQRPTKIEWKEHLCNSISLIGWITSCPFKRFRKESGKSVVHTKLGVAPSGKSSKMIWISLELRDKMAEISFKHLKPNDYVYVSGHLHYYTIDGASGKHETLYKVIVKDLNYVDRTIHEQTSQKRESSELQEEIVSTTDHEAKNCDRLRLWQVFFASPHEWWDNRHKKNRRSADFKHKDTGEALWLDPKDPPWVRAQLKLLDSTILGLRDRKTNFGSAQSHLSKHID